MDYLAFIKDIIKYAIAGAAVVWVAFYLVKPYLDRDDKLQLLEFRKAISAQAIPLRLQAYERLVLFIERVNPANMLIRLNATAYSAQELQSLIVEDIRSEYQHNITQQIYVSSRAWAVLKHIKDDTVNIVSNAVKSMPENATGLELSKTILNYLAQLEEDLSAVATGRLRKDLEELF